MKGAPHIYNSSLYDASIKDYANVFFDNYGIDNSTANVLKKILLDSSDTSRSYTERTGQIVTTTTTTPIATTKTTPNTKESLALSM